MHEFSPYASTMGGLLIGLAAGLLPFVNGRVAGIGGIANGVLFPQSRRERAWRSAFVAGLVRLVPLGVSPER